MSNQGMQVQLPERVTLQLTTQDAITILGALQDAGPYKVVFPVIRTVEQQLMAQQLQQQFKGPPPGAPVKGIDPPAPVIDPANDPANDVPAEAILPLG